MTFKNALSFAVVALLVLPVAWWLGVAVLSAGFVRLVVVAPERNLLLGAVGVTALLRAATVAGEWWLSLVEPTAGRVIAVTCAEHLFGGALTTALFAYMMSRVDRRLGATHYTLLATVEVWGKLPSAWVSGLVTDHTSYAWLFGLSTVLSLAFLGLLVPLRRLQGAAPRAAAPAGAGAPAPPR